jgi:hypothetical protein
VERERGGFALALGFCLLEGLVFSLTFVLRGRARLLRRVFLRRLFLTRRFLGWSLARLQGYVDVFEDLARGDAEDSVG